MRRCSAGTCRQCAFNWPVLRDNVLAEVGRLEGLYEQTLGNQQGRDFPRARRRSPGRTRCGWRAGGRSPPARSSSPPARGRSCREIEGIEHAISSNEVFHLDRRVGGASTTWVSPLTSSVTDMVQAVPAPLTARQLPSGDAHGARSHFRRPRPARRGVRRRRGERRTGDGDHGAGRHDPTTTTDGECATSRRLRRARTAAPHKRRSDSTPRRRGRSASRRRAAHSS